MKYFDSGDREEQSTLAHWLKTILDDEVIEVRAQTGFFSLDAIGLFVETLERCRQDERPVNILLGSNDAGTLRQDVASLAEIIGIPRDHAQLGIVSFDNGFFHPKTYHFRRADGSQAAFVGSANLTPQGLALHVEAGIAFDTRDDDVPQHLEQIANAIDRWFTDDRAGMTLITGSHDLDALTENGVLALTPPPRENTQTRNGETGGRTPRPRLRSIFSLPEVRTQTTDEQEPSQQPTTSADSALPIENREGFPSYLYFEPESSEPTQGASALTGYPLPEGAVGLIIKLTRDSEKKLRGDQGTAHISIPIDTAKTLRFGLYGDPVKPGGIFELHWRYVSQDILLDGGRKHIKVLAYGYTESEKSHPNIRLTVPSDVKRLGEDIERAGKVSPTKDDLALLEWPTSSDPAFRLSFVDKQSHLYGQMVTLFEANKQSRTLVGGACWLPPELPPNW